MNTHISKLKRKGNYTQQESLSLSLSPLLYICVYVCVLCCVFVDVAWLFNFICVDISRGWWTELLYASVIGPMKDFFKRVERKNTLFQAWHNISRHYDLVRAYTSLTWFLLRKTIFPLAEVYHKLLPIIRRRRISTKKR